MYEEMEFDCNHFAVFENAIDVSHIHYLHADSFGNQGAPEVRDMEAEADAFGVTATLKIQNKPVNAFWALFKASPGDVDVLFWLCCFFCGYFLSGSLLVPCKALPYRFAGPCG